MASIEEIKAGINRFGQQTQQSVAQLHAVHNSLEQSLALLRTVTAGTNHPAIGQAIGQIEQVKAKLNEASQLTMGAIDTTKRYAASF